MLWTRPAGGGQLMYVIQNPDSTYVSSGTSAAQIFLVKRDTAGNTIWTRSYPGEMYNPSNNNLIRTSTGGYAVCASYTSGTAMLMKTDSNGDTLWTKPVPGNDGVAITETPDRGYALTTWDTAGLSMILVRTDSNGVVLFAKYFGGAGDDWSQSVQLTSDGGFVLAGGTNSFGSDYQFFLVKTDSLGNIPAFAAIAEIADENSALYPNPFSRESMLHFDRHLENAMLEVTDMLGRTVMTIRDISGTQMIINRGELIPGLYLYRLSEAGHPLLQGKFIIE